MSHPPKWRIGALFSVSVLVVAMGAPGAIVDVASTGIASQTSEWNGGSYPAARAIDGDPGTFSHSDRDTPNNAWELLLDGDYKVSSVELVMRGDCCAGRMGGTTVRLFDGEGDSVFDQEVVDPGIGQTAVFDIPSGTFARQLRVGFENGATNPDTGTTTLLHLAEVRVFAEETPLPEIVSFTASPSDIASGEGATLSWTTTGGNTVKISGVGTVAASGSISVSPASSAVFTLRVSNAQGSRVASVAVLVDGELLPPRLNEFMASNAGSLTRGDGSTPDWIEIWNPNPVAIDLAGYRLTDDTQQPARYVFPSTPLGAGEFLIIDAAPTAVDGVPATGFSLDRDEGSTLSFANPSVSVLQSFTYPKQRSDISYGIGAEGAAKHFLIPTPGEHNTDTGVDGFVADTQFSLRRGFYASPQSVAISSATEAATIYFTTDGSEPSADNLAATRYSDPISISTTTVLRAAAFLDGYQPTDVDTQTYIFSAYVGSQASAPADFPQAWVPNLNGVQASVPAFSDFGMDAGVLGALPLNDSDGQSFDLPDALAAIPTMSLVVDAEILFDPAEGLHVNAQERGRAWERPASIEYLDPSSGEVVQADCGLRMHGGWNRYPEMLKKSFRLYFRSEYGDSKFRFPLFPDVGVGEFDRLILRSGNGKAWPSPWRALSGTGNSLERTTYLRDQFARDLQAATGNTHIPGRFVHLYINGHYWGLYNPVERPDEHFAVARFGGVDEDYDVIKWQRGVGHRVAAGDDVGWNALIALVRGTPADVATYVAVGELLELPGFVDYILVNYFLGNIDWIDNNVYAMRNRTAGAPFRFFCWDSEESLLSTGADATVRVVSDTCSEIHQALRANLEYRQLFADRAHQHLFNSGALTPAVSDAIFAGRAAEIDRAIFGESARWGALRRPANPYDRADWIAEVNNIRGNYLTTRTTTTLSQLRADSLYPSIAPPIFTPQRGGSVEVGFELSLAPPAGFGAVYYTLDGSDPRLPGGGVSASALAFGSGSQPVGITADTLVRARLLNAGEWSAIDEALYLVGDRATDIYVAEIMYHPAAWVSGDAEFLEIANRGSVTHRLDGLLLTGGIEFEFANSAVAELPPGGRIVLVRDAAAFAQAYGGVAIAGEYDKALGNGGDQFSLESRDGTVLWTLSYSDSAPWPGGVDGDGHSLTALPAEGGQSDATRWRASVSVGGSPGADDRVPLTPGESLIGYALVDQRVQFAVGGSVELHMTAVAGADDVELLPEWSLDLKNWSREGLSRVRLAPGATGQAVQVWAFETPPMGPALFFRTSARER